MRFYVVLANERCFCTAEMGHKHERKTQKNNWDRASSVTGKAPKEGNECLFISEPHSSCSKLKPNVSLAFPSFVSPQMLILGKLVKTDQKFSTCYVLESENLFSPNDFWGKKRKTDEKDKTKSCSSRLSFHRLSENCASLKLEVFVSQLVCGCLETVPVLTPGRLVFQSVLPSRVEFRKAIRSTETVQIGENMLCRKPG